MAASQAAFIVGPQLLATIVSAILFGLATQQTYVYYTSFSNTDRRRLRLLVAIVWILDMAHMAFAISYIYEMSVINYGNVDSLTVVSTSLSASVFMTSGLLMIIPLFMVYRIQQLSSCVALSILCAPIAAARSVTLCALAVLSLGMESVQDFVAKYRLLMLFSLANGAFADVLLSGFIVFLLLKKQRELVFIGTTRILDKLILCTIESGAITGLVSLTNLICLITMPMNWVWLGVLTIMPQVYANTFLTCLNRRQLDRALYAGNQTFRDSGALHFETASPTIAFIVPRAERATNLFPSTDGVAMEQRSSKSLQVDRLQLERLQT